jgi:hypothetical protein
MKGAFKFSKKAGRISSTNLTDNMGVYDHSIT